MAFSKNNSSNNSGNTNQDWKADGFINLYLPRADGGKRKLGTVMLYKKNAAEEQLLETLMKDPEAIARLQAALIVEFNTAEIKEGSGFAI